MLLENKKPCASRFVNVIDGCDDVGMVERGQDFGLALEPSHAFAIARKLIGQP
jgi:hypothetical protein